MVTWMGIRFMIYTRVFFQRRFRPIADRLADAGVTANQVTITAGLLSCAAGTTIIAAPGARWPLLLIPLVLCVRLPCNHIDGILAREHGMATPLGAILNDLIDVVSDVMLYLPMALVAGVTPELLVPAVVLGVLSEFAGILGQANGAERRHDGPLSKFPRGVGYGAIALALGLGAAPGLWLDALLVILMLLSALTIANRVQGALGQLE